MEDNQKDKIYELEVSGNGMNGKIRLQNIHSRVLATIGDIALDTLSYFRWSNAVRFLDRYEEKKRKRNIIGKETPIAPKFLIEILENAFIEDDQNLQEIWSNLLINWQDDTKRFDKKMMYIEIVKNLCPIEIKILESIYRMEDYETFIKEPSSYFIGEYLENILGLTKEEYELAMLNLFRLKCCEGFHPPKVVATVGDIPIVADGGIYKFRLTIIGINLIRNCIEE